MEDPNATQSLQTLLDAEIQARQQAEQRADMETASRKRSSQRSAELQTKIDEYESEMVEMRTKIEVEIKAKEQAEQLVEEYRAKESVPSGTKEEGKKRKRAVKKFSDDGGEENFKASIKTFIQNTLEVSHCKKTFLSARLIKSRYDGADVGDKFFFKELKAQLAESFKNQSTHGRRCDCSGYFGLKFKSRE
jgi:hypothetical protein